MSTRGNSMGPNNMLFIILFVIPHHYISATELDAVDMWDRLINTRLNTPRNRDKLITAYASICPMQTYCDIIPDSIFRYKRPTSIPKCPACTCYPYCIFNYNCCASHAHNYIEYACVKTVMFPPDSSNMNSFRMVATCSETFNGIEDTRQKCQNVTSEHNDGPVTSIQTYLTYINKYCAICNNDYQDYVAWLYDISCENETDKQFYESFEELKKAQKENNCIIQSSLPTSYRKYMPSPCISSESSLIDKCNVSGLWDSYDPDIDWACANLNLAYDQFKNVFCYICNPSIASSRPHELIDVCNVTGRWKKYAPDIEDACLTQPMTSRLSPYKNIHCLLCNSFESFSDSVFEMTDKKAMYFENYTKHNYSIIDVEVVIRNNTLLWSLEDFVRTWFQDRFEISQPSTVNQQQTGTIDEQAVGSTHTDTQGHISDRLYTQIDGFVAVCGNHVCESTIQAGYIGNVRKHDISDNSVCGTCDCNDVCAALGSCCPDFLLNKNPYSSVNENHFTTFISSTDFKVPPPSGEDLENKSFLVIDKCLGNHNTDEMTTKRCHMTSTNTSQTDILMNIPVQIKGLRTVPYKNMYCLLCNLPNTSIGLIHLRFQCPGYIETPLHLDFFDFLNATKPRCAISFVINSDTAVQYQRTASVQEPGVIYKRNYPFFLNKSTLRDDVKVLIVDNFLRLSNDYEFYWKCNQTGLYSAHDDNVQAVCEDDSETIFALPQYIYNNRAYKNYACFICNPTVDPTTYDRDMTVSVCNVTGSWNKLSKPTGELNETTEALCETTVSHDRWLPFKNVYCSECNLKEPRTKFFYHWGEDSNTDRYSPGFYRALFSLSGQEWQRYMNEDDAHPTRDCQNGTYDNIRNICRDLVCSNGRLLYNDTCRTLLKRGYDVIYDITFTLKPRAEENGKQNVSLVNTADDQQLHTYRRDNAENVNLDQVCSYVTTTVRKLLNDTLFTVLFCKFSWKQGHGEPCTEDNTVVLSYMSSGLDVSFSLIIGSIEDITKTESSLLKAKSLQYDINTGVNKSLYVQAIYTNIDTSGQNQSVKICSYERLFYKDSTIGLKSVTVNKFLTCPQVQFTQNEYTIDNATNSIILTESNLTFTRGNFKIEQLTALICKDDFLQGLTLKHNTKVITIHSEHPLQAAYAIFSTVCTALSLLCLAATLLTYSLFKALRTLPGKNNMTLSAALFCAQAFLQFGLSIPDKTIACPLIGATLHFFWLSTFCAMNVCAFHMFNVFFLGSLSAPSSPHNHLYIRYVLYTVMAPLTVVIITLSGHLIASDGNNSGYGRNFCFLSDVTTLIPTFIIPSAIIFLSNIAFFSLAFHKIRTSPRVANSTSSERRDFLLYLKLCTIVGLTWPLVLVDANLQLSTFSFFVVGINASQGVFIFIAYICNKRVWDMYKTRFCVSTRGNQLVGKSSSGQTQTRSTGVSETKLTNVALEKKHDKIEDTFKTK